MSFTIMMRNPFRKLHRAAYSGTAICPSCYGSKVKLLERIGPYVVRYQCKGCHQTYREDLTPQGHFGDDRRTREVGKPYHSFRGLNPEYKVGVHRFKKS